MNIAIIGKTGKEELIKGSLYGKGKINVYDNINSYIEQKISNNKLTAAALFISAQELWRNTEEPFGFLSSFMQLTENLNTPVIVYDYDLNPNDETNVFNISIKGRDEFLGYKIMEHSWWRNDFVNSIAARLYNNPQIIAWVGDYADDVGFSADIYELCHGSSPIAKDVEYTEFNLVGKFILNHTKEKYINCDKFYRKSYEKASSQGWVVHPLPLLVAAGNGQGGGDYYGENENLVGQWCLDEISIRDEVPEGFTEDTTIFYE